MTSIISPSPEIDQLRFEPIPTGRPCSVERMIRVQNFVVVLGKNGKLYSPNLRDRVCYTPDNWPWTDALLKALVKLGVISKEAAAVHFQYAERMEAARERKESARTVKAHAAALGIKFTKSQLTTLTEADNG